MKDETTYGNTEINKEAEGTLSFTCQLCGNPQALVSGPNRLQYIMTGQITFPICDECIEDLKGIIMQRRTDRSVLNMIHNSGIKKKTTKR